ncbi:MAG: phage tail protein I [Chloroflexi bacterium]|nr:phage tail protein I [Chloroflexota bacterium]
MEGNAYQGFEFRLRIEGPKGVQELVLPLGITTIGRQAGNDLQLDDPQVSRRHAQFDCTLTECQITDLGSTNGTRVNGERLPPQVPRTLAGGNVVEIGGYRLLLEQIPVRAQAETKAPMPPEAEPASKERPALEATSPALKPIPPLSEEEAPPAPPAPPAPSAPSAPAEGEPLLPPGLDKYSRRLLDYLPSIYHTDLMSRFLALFESILLPIEWTIDGFDLCLHAGSAPADLLPWLASWFDVVFDPTWSEAQRRTLLAEAHKIYARRGTRWALSRVLEIYTGQRPVIEDGGEGRTPFTFRVSLPSIPPGLNRELIERVIDVNKPAHTTYTLEIEG